MALTRTWITWAALLAASAGVEEARAFGADGHRVAGEVAEQLLCTRTADEIETLTDGESLAEIGTWADRVRDEDPWRHTGPWHFMNIEDGLSIEDFDHPPEGDVLWAIQRHAEILAEPGSRGRRAAALRFLVHFIVDIHQPLHVGRVEDRGGNRVDVQFRGGTSNLHRFWDSDVLRLDGLSVAEHAARLAPLARMLARRDHTSPTDWAAESMALRSMVYDFETRNIDIAVLDEAYIDAASLTTRVRLAQAAVRVAATLNELLGDPGCARRN